MTPAMNARREARHKAVPRDRSRVAGDAFVALALSVGNLSRGRTAAVIERDRGGLDDLGLRDLRA